MISINIKISEVGNPPLWPEIKPKLKGNLTKVGVLEAGMQSGATSLWFIVETPEGAVVAETSLAILNQIHAVANGADKHFKEKPERN
jgi:hypothetical protein